MERRHAKHFLALAVSANLSLGTPGEQRFDLAISEEGNLRAALGWALAHDEIDSGWSSRSRSTTSGTPTTRRKGRGGLPACSARRRVLPPRCCYEPPWGTATRAVGSMTNAATALYRDALALARELGDERAMATDVPGARDDRLRKGDYDESERLIDEGQAANETAGSPAVEVMRLETLARLAAYRDGDIGLARELVGQALTVARAAGLAFWEAEEADELGLRARRGAARHRGDACPRLAGAQPPNPSP